MTHIETEMPKVHPALNLGYQSFPETSYLERLERGLQKSAQIVALFGEDYLPIFKRIEYELEKEKTKQRDLKRAIDLAKSV